MKKKILIVDDESSARFLISLMLKNLYECDSSPDSTSAFDKASENGYDLILMDVNLGNSESGVTALKKIRSINGYENIPVIAVTAYAMSKDRQELMNMGFDEYVSKPFEKDELLSVVEKILHKEREPRLKTK